MEKAQKDGIEFGTLIKDQYYYNKQTGWFFLKVNQWYICLRLAPVKFFPIPSHCHQDFGAPIILYKNKEILIDKGRFSYESKYSFEESASSHSTILINHKPTINCERDLGIIPKFNIGINFRYYQIKDKVNLVIRYPLSIENKLKVFYAIRLISLRTDSIEIKDRVRLSRKSLITTHFHFPEPLPELSISFSYKIDNDFYKKFPVDECSKLVKLSKRAIDYNNYHKALSLAFETNANSFFSSSLLFKI